MRGARASCGSISSVGSSRSPAGATRQRVGGGASKPGSPPQTVAAIAVGPDSRGSSPAVSKQSELAGLRQQQCQHAARQLFGELQGVQQVKAVASSGSYWCNLSGCDLYAGDAGRVGGGGTQRCALPLVG